MYDEYGNYIGDGSGGGGGSIDSTASTPSTDWGSLIGQSGQLVGGLVSLATNKGTQQPTAAGTNGYYASYSGPVTPAAPSQSIFEHIGKSIGASAHVAMGIVFAVVLFAAYLIFRK